MHRQRCSHPLGSTIGLNSIFLNIISDNFTYPCEQSQPKSTKNCFKPENGWIYFQNYYYYYDYGIYDAYLWMLT